METYILKFSACLGVFWLVYVFFLERQNMHRFKRFYLLATLILALVIPTLTITEYVEPFVTGFETAPEYFPIELAIEEVTIEEVPFFNLETILWLIYGLGVLVFTSRFIINLIRMQRRISKNENIKTRSFIYVLLQENTIPHSFFRYIFFNKTRYASNNIPKEVLLHEETHSKQLHSLDIIILELLQIAFWFHPLIYILKHHVKLNHEFLADQAVLKQGVNTKTYQNILLQFSSNTQDYQFSSAINYSSIKKRFTVMKTQTSKTRVWLSTLLVLPIIAILFYSFAEKEYVEKEESSIIDHVEHIKDELKIVEELPIHYVDQNVVEIYLKKYDIYEALRTTEPHYINKLKQEQEKLDDLFSDLGGLYYRMSEENKAKVKRPISPIKPYVQITLNGITYYKKRNELTAEETAALLPPPPPPLSIQKANYNLKEKPIMVILINRNGELLVENNYASLESIEWRLKTLSKSFDESNSVFVRIDKSDASEKTLENVIALVRKYDFKIIQSDAPSIAPPPPPIKQTSKGGPNAGDTQSVYNPSFLEYIIEMDNEDATFYLDDEKISAKEAKAIAINNNGKRTNMTTQKDADGNYLVKLSSAEKKKIYARSIELKVLNENSYLIDGIKATKETFVDVFNQLHQDITPEQRKIYMNIHVKSSKEISNKEVWFIYNSLQDYGFYRIVAPNQEINRAKGNTPFAIESHFSEQEIATDKEVAEYNAWARQLKKETLAAQEDESNGKTANYPIVKQKDLIKYVGIYKRMTSAQKENSVELPIADDELKTTGLKFPPPPPPETTLDFIVRMAKANAKFFNQGKSISSDEAIALIKTNPKLNVNAQKTDTARPLIYISKKPILIGVKGKADEQLSINVMVNGKAIRTSEIEMTIETFKNLELSTKNGNISSFKLKIPGKATQFLKGHSIDLNSVKHISDINIGDHLVLFDIKDDSDIIIEPLIIKITN
ncbi:M56 family metallopeptidase [Winogradskyella sediminis]|uniref:M56 family metallopeptidase n=1 Tax=Winogradskyella sediminis TaxID=1382466 RepID=UPI000E265468|nr:M56 family metallopeptidase [Winogradskyella sediminis]REG89771.1 BlaR1 peptidase M56 [Winogradskyella sediminis]